jgi:purine-nucleoside phosphorylase
LKSVDYLVSKGILNPEVGLVLGTGLGKFLDYLEVEQTIDYAEIPNFPVSQ